MLKGREIYERLNNKMPREAVSILVRLAEDNQQMKQTVKALANFVDQIMTMNKELFGALMNEAGVEGASNIVDKQLGTNMVESEKIESEIDEAR